MSSLTVYTVKIAQDDAMPEQWLRSHLDDMFGHDVTVWIEDSSELHHDIVTWVCRDCGLSFNGAANPDMEECSSCGGGLRVKVKDL